MINAVLPLRGHDAWGDGSFGAPRGNHTHRGIDFACYPETLICAVCDGEVTKIGYPYADDLKYRYVQVTSGSGMKHRYFYVTPMAVVGEVIFAGDVIGASQNIAARYSTPEKPMKNHVHYEIMFHNEYFDPAHKPDEK